MLTSVLPAGGLPGFANALSNFSLVLNSAGNVYNAGNISSAANLSVFAGNAITSSVMSAQGNLGLNAASSVSNIVNSSMTAGILQAVNSISVVSPNVVNTAQITSVTSNISIITNILQNSGVVQSLAGNIGIEALAKAALNIDNNSGTIKALAGSIAIDAASGETLQLLGGKLLAGGAVTIDAAGSISVGDLNLQSVFGTGSNLSMDSKINSYSMSSINVSSQTNAAGAVWLLVSTVDVTVMSVSFTAGSNLFAFGTSATSTPSLSFALANANSLNRIETRNSGTGNSGRLAASLSPLHQRPTSKKLSRYRRSSKIYLKPGNAVLVTVRDGIAAVRVLTANAEEGVCVAVPSFQFSTRAGSCRFWKQ